MSHTVAMTDSKLRNSSALEYVVGQLRLPRYFLPWIKITEREHSFRDGRRALKRTRQRLALVKEKHAASLRLRHMTLGQFSNQEK